MKKFNKITVILLALMLTCVIAITASFSWLTRPNGTTDPANAIGLTGTAVVKTANNCDIQTSICNMVNGELDEGTPVLIDSVTIPANSTQYFKTVITNKADSRNNVSLTNLQLSAATATVNSLSPLKTSVAYKSGGVSVAEHLTIEAKGSLTVEWYICNNGSELITVTNLPEITYYS